jgi:hypothetical protein
MVELRVSASIENRQPLELRLNGHHAIRTTTHARLLLFEVGEAETSWRMSPGTLEVSRPSSESLGLLVEAAGNLPSGLYEIHRVALLREEETLSVLQGGRDFPRTFFEVRGPGQKERTAAEVNQTAFDREALRDVVFSQPLGDPAGRDAQEFRFVSFVERCFLTRTFRFPGFELLPLQAEGIGSDIVQVVNQFLAINGWATRIPSDQWLAREAGRRPLVLFHFPRVFAATSEEGGRIVRRLRDRVLDLLAVHRGTSSAPLVTIVETLLDPAVSRYGDGRWLFEGRPYTGNLLGGVISGENPFMILRHLRALESDPLLALWAGLFRDARGEPDVDFAFFRFWNLLETMATGRIPSGLPVTDLKGAALASGSKPATTEAPLGRVFELLKRVLQREKMSEQVFATAHPKNDLWAEAAVWYGFRNATAHHGGFRIEDPEQQRQWWYKLVYDVYQRATERESPPASPTNRYLGDLREAAERVLHSELDLVASGLPSLL